MIEVKRGDSYSFAVALKGITDLTGYSCSVQLRNASDGTLRASSTPTATADATYGQVFVVQMTDVQSQGLDIGKQYTLGAQISDGAGFAREECRTLKIVKECVYT